MQGISQYVNQQKKRWANIRAEARRLARLREQEAAKEEARQKALSQRLNRAITLAMRGVMALVAVRVRPDALKAISSLAAIGQSLVVYHAQRDGGNAWEALVNGYRDGGGYVWGTRGEPYDHILFVSVSIGWRGVGLHINLDSAHAKLKSRSYELWVGPKMSAAKLQLELSKLIFWDNEYPFEITTLREFREAYTVDEDLLDAFKAGSPALAARPGQRKFEWNPEFLLLRFLQECANPKNLHRYLSKAKPSGKVKED